MKNDVTTSIRFPSFLLKKLQKQADIEHMTMPMYIRRVLMRDVGMLKKHETRKKM